MVSVYQSRDYPSMGDRAALPFPSKLLAINQPLVQWKRGNGMNSGLHRRSLAETSYSFSKQPAAHSLDSTWISLQEPGLTCCQHQTLCSMLVGLLFALTWYVLWLCFLRSHLHISSKNSESWTGNITGDDIFTPSAEIGHKGHDLVSPLSWENTVIAKGVLYNTLNSFYHDVKCPKYNKQVSTVKVDPNLTWSEL